MRRISRRQLLTGAARAGVGIGALALAGCSSPEAFNDGRDRASRPSSPPGPQPSQEAAPVRGREPALSQTAEEEQQQPAQAPSGGARVSGSARLVASGSDVFSLSAPSRPRTTDPVDAAEWRDLHHWSPLPSEVDRLWGGGLGLLPLLYSRLVRFAVGEGVDAHSRMIESDLSAGWELADAATVVFSLRPDAVWTAEDGSAERGVSARDVQEMHERYREASAPQSGAYRDVRLIEADDLAGTVRFSLDGPRAARMLEAMAGPDHAIMPPGWEPSDSGRFTDPSAPPAGSGPFLFERGQGIESTWEVRRNRHYFGRDAAGPRLPYLDRIRGQPLSAGSGGAFSARPDDTWDAWLSGQLDAIQCEGPAEVTASLETFPAAAAQVVAPVPGAGLAIEFPRGVADAIADLRVRLALSMGIDRAALADQRYGGMAAADCGMDWSLVADSDGKPREWPWTAEELGSSYRSDPAEARALLEAAGYSEKAPLQISMAKTRMRRGAIYQGDPVDTLILHSVTTLLRPSLGRLAEVRSVQRVDEPEMRVNTETGNAFIAGPGVNASLTDASLRRPGDPDPALYVPHGGWLRTGPVQETDDEQLRRLWEQQRMAVDFAERSEMLERVRARRGEVMETVHLVNRYGLHVRRGNVFGLVGTFFAHDPAGAASQLARVWKSG